jgi:hypothetical protein
MSRTRQGYYQPDFEDSPMPGEERGYREGDDIVPVSTGSMLDAGRNSNSSAARVGNRLVSSGQPTPVFETVNTFAFLKDLLPKQQSKLGVNLETVEYNSAATALTIGYIDTNPAERFSGDGGSNPEVGIAPYRDHQVYIEFGAGSTPFQMEVDAGEGNMCNVSGSMLRVSLIDWTYFRGVTFTYDELKTDVSASRYTNPTVGTSTTRVLAPCQAAIDLADPPSLVDWKKTLLQANVGTDYLN